MPAETSPYAPHRTPDRVFRFQPYGLPLRLFYTVLFGAAALGVVAGAFFAARDVALDCSRDTGLCVITRTYPLFGAYRESHPLAAIEGSNLRQRTTKNGGLAYAVTLRTAQGEIGLSASYAAAGRQQAKRELDAFLGNPEAPPLHLLYDRGSPYAFLLCLFALVMVQLLWSLWQEATVRFQDWRRAVVLERRRWPLPLWTRTLPADQVTGTRIASRGVSRRRTYRLLLVLNTGEEVPLLEAWGGARLAYYQRAADDLDLLVQR